MQTSGVTKVPRLMVATEFPPNASGGGPAVVRQMLRNWPVEKLYWWCCGLERDATFGQKVAECRIAKVPSRLYPNDRFRRTKSWCLEHIWTRWAANHFRATLAAVKPDVVWVIPHAWAVPPLAAILPFANVGFHVTVQDYVNTHERAIRFGQARGRRMALQAEKLYASATTRDATSHPMIRDLQQRTGAAAVQMLHAGLDETDFAWLANKPLSSSRRLQIAYAGTVIAEDAFEVLVKALEIIRKQLPVPVSLEFFGNHSYAGRRWFDCSWMNERGNLAEPALTNALRECNWGFSPMLLDPAGDPLGNKFSFPTKFISYLAAGLPIITIGHEESTVMKMARTYEVGFSTNEPDPRRLAAQLLPVLSDPDPWPKFRGEIKRCATTEFDARRMRAVLHECFLKGAATTRHPMASALTGDQTLLA